MIRYEERICRDLEAASRREWLETNGIGGFASATVAGIHTRRYHGLLVAALRPPVGRVVLLSKFEEAASTGGRRYELSANRYPGVVHPRGFERLVEFRLDPFPVFVYDLDGCELEKSVFMVHGENTTVIRYVLRGDAACSLELRPLIAFRDYHHTTHENAALDPALTIAPGSVRTAPYQGLPPLYLSHSEAEALQTGEWYRNFEYEVERARGLDFQEDLFNPCVLSFRVTPGKPAVVIASTEARDASRGDAYAEAEIRRRAALLDGAAAGPFVRALVTAADQYVVRRGNENSIIAGYHWFSDWGRDTMIALPGIALATNRPNVARGILLAFAAAADRGMLPNRFPDAGEMPEYNTVDATLWFFEAVRAFVAHSGDYDFVRRHLYEALSDIVGWHERGTRYGIRVDSDGLLAAGEPGAQLTWMDAKIGEWVVTPRHGKPVEIQALWYNALRTMEDLARAYGLDEDGRRFAQMAEGVRRSFRSQFWNAEAGCLFDVVNGESRDGSIRPNQIFAVSLHNCMLPGSQATAVVDAVERHLLTPYGLRSLAPSDPRYRGQYAGDPASRDSAYHQGTVWPWLLGPFITAWLRVRKHSPAALARAEEMLAPLRSYLEDEGAGQIPEVFSGDPPHQAGGCIAQAWSVAELLRVAVSEMEVRRPKATAAA